MPIPITPRRLVANLLGGLACCAALGCSTSSATAPGGSTPVASLGWSFTPDAGFRTLMSMEPNVLSLADATLLYLSAPPSNSVLSSADGLTFVPRAAQTTGGHAQSFVQLPDGRYREYYLSGSNLVSATSADGLRWTSESGVRIVLNSIAVPFVAAMPGGYRVYYVTSGGPSSISSAFSVDGLTFAMEGIRIPAEGDENWADPSVTRLENGAWLMTFSDFNSNANTYSRLWLASSSDGLTWTRDAAPIAADAAKSLADPSALVPLGANRYRFYYGACPGFAPLFTGVCDIASGVIRR